MTLVLVALLMGMTWCHVLELPAKMQYPATLYLTLHRTLYVAFGPPNIGAFIEVGSIVAAAVLVFLVRQRRPALWLTLLGAVSLAAGLAVYFAYVEPANVALKSMALEAPPAGWKDWRVQWELGHAAHFVLHLIGFSALVLSVVLEAPTRHLTPRRAAPDAELHPSSRQAEQ
jgi:hypothetical protein